MDKISKNGFVLFATLIFLYLFSLISIYSLMSATMTLQLIRDRWSTHFSEKKLLTG